jgi:hypothetical protein
MLVANHHHQEHQLDRRGQDHQVGIMGIIFWCQVQFQLEEHVLIHSEWIIYAICCLSVVVF